MVCETFTHHGGQQRDAWQYGALIDAADHVKNAPIQGKFADTFKTQYDNQRVNGRDNAILLTAPPRMTKPLLPLDKYGQPLENLDLDSQ
jgi:hypothetical protein